MTSKYLQTQRFLRRQQTGIGDRATGLQATGTWPPGPLAISGSLKVMLVYTRDFGPAGDWVRGASWIPDTIREGCVPGKTQRTAGDGEA